MELLLVNALQIDIFVQICTAEGCGPATQVGPGKATTVSNMRSVLGLFLGPSPLNVALTSPSRPSMVLSNFTPATELQSTTVGNRVTMTIKPAPATTALASSLCGIRFVNHLDAEVAVCGTLSTGRRICVCVPHDGSAYLPYAAALSSSDATYVFITAETTGGISALVPQKAGTYDMPALRGLLVVDSAAFTFVPSPLSSPSLSTVVDRTVHVHNKLPHVIVIRGMTEANTVAAYKLLVGGEVARIPLSPAVQKLLVVKNVEGALADELPTAYGQYSYPNLGADVYVDGSGQYVIQ